MPRTITNADVRGNPYRIREPFNAALTEIWLVTAIVTVLVIRLYLWLTGYPQVGGDTLHIAHMLWGGLGMVIAFAMVMLFVHSVWKPIAAVVGGIGFGAFIDELGKFITKDNDYFFQPTISIMYGVFLVLYAVARYFGRKREPTEADHLYMAVQGVQWQAIGKLDKRRQQIALDHLEASGNTSPLADELRNLLENAQIVESVDQSRIFALREKIAALYWRSVQNNAVRTILIIIFLVRVFQIAGAGLLAWRSDDLNVTDGITWTEGVALATGFASGAVAAYGLVQMLRRRRVEALHAFSIAALVSLLFGQFFAFAVSQFAAMGGLVLDLGVLGCLRLALSVENDRYNERGTGEDPREGLGTFL